MYISKVEWDSIYLRDSVFIKEKGDTIWRVEWHDRWRERLKTDTVWQDKVKIVVEKETVERTVTPKWAWWAVGIAGVCLLGLVGIIGFKIWRRARGLK